MSLSLSKGPLVPTSWSSLSLKMYLMTCFGISKFGIASDGGNPAVRLACIHRERSEVTLVLAGSGFIEDADEVVPVLLAEEDIRVVRGEGGMLVVLRLPPLVELADLGVFIAVAKT